MTLYEINQNILSLIDEETGEITDIVAFEALLGAKDAKIENIIKLYKNATADSTALKAEADAFTKRAKAAAALADRMKMMLEAELDGNTFECTTGKVSFRKSKALIVDDEARIPEQYQKIAFSVDKAALKKAIESGENIAGAHIEVRQNVQVK